MGASGDAELGVVQFTKRKEQEICKPSPLSKSFVNKCLIFIFKKVLNKYYYCPLFLQRLLVSTLRTLLGLPSNFPQKNVTKYCKVGTLLAL